MISPDVAQRCSIRMMTSADLSAVMAIERRAYPFPWTQGIFADCLRVGYLCRVLELDDNMVGYGVVSHGAGEAHLLNLCVAPEQQGKGLGRFLLDSLLRDALKLGAQSVFLEVRKSNQSALNLYRDMGFNEIGVRENYYPANAGREDAIVFGYELSAWAAASGDGTGDSEG